MAKNFSCSICKKQFRTDNGLIWHLSNIHASKSQVEIRKFDVESTIARMELAQNENLEQAIVGADDSQIGFSPAESPIISFETSFAGYPDRTLPLIPKVMVNVPGFNSRIEDFPIGRLTAGSYEHFSDLDTDAWDILGDETCHRLAFSIKQILAEDIARWAKSEKGQIPIGLSIAELSNLELSPRVKNGLERSLQLLDFNILDQPTVKHIVQIRNFGPSAVLELFGRLESDFGPDLPIKGYLPDAPARIKRRASAVNDLVSNGPVIPEAIWVSPVDYSFSATRRTIACLRRARVKCLGDLISLSETELLSIRNFGVKSLQEVKDLLAHLNLSLRGDGEPIPKIESVDYEILDGALTQDSLGRPKDLKLPKPMNVSLHNLFEIPEIGVRGVLEILGALEMTSSSLDIASRYPDLPFPLLPQAIRENSVLLSAINDYLGQQYIDSDWESSEFSERALIGGKILNGIEILLHDRQVMNQLVSMTVQVPSNFFERFSLTEETRSMLSSGKVIRPVGGDPKDAWDYIDSRVGERQATILRKRWRDDETLEAVGQFLGITRERVRQLEVKSKKTLRHGKSGLKAKGITERINWVEMQLLEAVERQGGNAEISSIETALGWPERSVKTWFAFDSAVGVLGSEFSRKPGDFGRLVFDKIHISSLATLVEEPGERPLAQLVKDIIGIKGMMELGDFIKAFDQQITGHGLINSDYLVRGRALENSGTLNLLEPAAQDNLTHEPWVAVGLTFPTREIARAILFGPIPNAIADDHESPDSSHLRTGVRTDLISDWLFHNSEHNSSARAIDVLCERYTDVFVRTGPTSWGLLGAGADDGIYQRYSDDETSILAMVVDAVGEIRVTKNLVSKADVAKWLSGYCSPAWIDQNIDKAVEKGYLINEPRGRPHFVLTVGKRLPENERYNSRKKL